VAQVARHHPVDEVVHLSLDELRHVLDHVALELDREPALDAADPQRVVEERYAAPFERVQNGGD
jgi:DNA-directed RNA polymerase subunit H (RpoH/RPB5)